MSSITVLGGGISGLSAAFHLSRRFPPRSAVRITLVEKSQRLGGWVRSERVRVKDGGGREADVLLESGPRTLRPTSKAILELIYVLGLTSSVLTVPSNAPAARNRFLRLPGTEGLTTIPGSLFSLLQSPLTRLLVPAVLRDMTRFNSTVSTVAPSNDESVDSFLARHFGADFAQTFGSALVHGIYAADSSVLSVRAAFPALCRLEESGKGSVVRGAVREMLSTMRGSSQKSLGDGTQNTAEYELGDAAELMKGVSVYSFRDGMQTLTNAMAQRLDEQTNVEIVKDDGVAALGRATVGGDFEVTTQSGKLIQSSHLVSAMGLPSLQRLLTASHHALPPSESGSSSLPLLPNLTVNPSSSVTVVNLVFPPTPTPVHPQGFGYLVPRPSTGYQPSSLGVLGTVFDSCALSAQDHQDASPASGPFTKLTVMLGGPHGTPSPAPSSPDFLPALLDTLRQHLGRVADDPLPKPSLVRVRQHANCIPTPTVGHTARMAELATAVRERWGVNAAVIGAGVGGVSVGDCVESGRRVALALRV